MALVSTFIPTLRFGKPVFATRESNIKAWEYEEEDS